MFSKTMSWVFSHKILAAIIAFFVLIVISIALTPVPPQNNTVSNEVEQHVVFDIPKLADKNKSEIIKILGTPITNLDDTIDYEKEGYNLLITFDKDKYQVIDFFFSKIGTSKIEQKEELTKLTNIHKESEQYELTMVKALGRSDEYTGLIIKPKN